MLVTLSDRKTPANLTAVGQPVTYYKPVILTANDYYPFGMGMPGRNFNAASTKDYRYGFNGKENDNEVKSEGNQVAFEARIYDSRIARFLTSDPIGSVYPFQSPYAFALNNPILLIDVNGLGPGDPPGTQTVTSANSDNMLIPETAKVTSLFSESGKATLVTSQKIVNVAPNSVRSFQLSNGKTYEAYFDSQTGDLLGYYNAADKKYYPTSVTYQNVALIPNAQLEANDKASHQSGNSAYAYDRQFFLQLERVSNGSLKVFEVGNIDDAAQQVKSYCEENLVVVSGLINDFHSQGGNILIGTTVFNDANIDQYSNQIGMIGMFMGESSKILLGNCLVGSTQTSALDKLSMYTNGSTVYAHKAFCMSTLLVLGCYAEPVTQRLEYGKRGKAAVGGVVDDWVKYKYAKYRKPGDPIFEEVKRVRFVTLDHQMSQWLRGVPVGLIGSIFEME